MYQQLYCQGSQIYSEPIGNGPYNFVVEGDAFAASSVRRADSERSAWWAIEVLKVGVGVGVLGVEKYLDFTVEGQICMCHLFYT